MAGTARPGHRVSAPARFPDLDAALAARGIALKAGGVDRRSAKASSEVIPSPQSPPRARVGLGALAGAVLGVAAVATLVFSVVRVSENSSPPLRPLLSEPATSTQPDPAPAVAQPVIMPAAPSTSGPAAALPEFEASTPPAPEEPQFFSGPNAIPIIAEALPPPEADTINDDSLRARLHDRFPLLLPAP